MAANTSPGQRPMILTTANRRMVLGFRRGRSMESKPRNDSVRIAPTSALPPSGWPHSTGVPVGRPAAGAGAAGHVYAQGAMSVLILDGDDTLWENNVHFEQAIEDFIDFLHHSTLSREQVRTTLDEIERLNSRVHGYGSVAFARNLRETYERLAERKLHPDDLDHVMNLGRRILDVELVLLPGVAETLIDRSRRHRLLLVTKGEPEEQRLKVRRSGLEDQFERVVVTKEKDVAGYRDLIRAHRIDVDRAWMVGNSPRSD